MEPEARYTFVGAAVLVLLALLVGSILWLKSSGSGREARPYRIAFEHQSLEGLTSSSDVTLRGVRVGAVTGYRFSKRNPNAIDVFISVVPGTPVLEGTRAAVGRNLLTGLATIQLNNPAAPGRPLRAGPDGGPPVIAEGQAAEQQLEANVSGVAQGMNALLSERNRAALAETLDNVRRLSSHADQTLARLDASLEALTGATRRVGRLADAVEGDAATLTRRYDELGAQAARTLGEAGQVVRQAGGDVERLTRRSDAILLNSGRDLQATTRSLRAAAQSIGLAADRLHEPSAILYGPGPGQLGPGEGRR